MSRLQRADSVKRAPVRLAWPLIVLICQGHLAKAASPPGEIPGLKAFLQRHLEGAGPHDMQTRYSAAQVSLHGQAYDVLVYILGARWCGSGGCFALLLERQGSSFRVINGFTLARLPIRILKTRSHGWHDIAMPVAGGGLRWHLAVLRFNGHRYPGNPSMAPTLASDQAAVEVPLQMWGELLYQ